MIKVFLVVTLVTSSGMVIPGQYMDGWSDREQPGVTVCTNRARFMERSTPPPGIRRIIARCELRNG